ncbi:MAG TPA: haloacid dehalogenase-like hydrolase [Gemmatimonadaceae bacterium]|nr:haloacid dehalogenase-like hydrolase [Gemmatimonadaceae bacterium]
MKLVLFDIDGTLLLSDGAGRRAIHRALIEVFGATGPEDYHFDGKTDRQIVRELMRLEGHGDAHIDAGMTRLLTRYVDCLHEELRRTDKRAYALPGVPQLLDALERRNNVVLGLLTGNVEPGARAKLAAAGLDFERFRVGAFGSDHEHRPELPAIARDRARGALGVDIAGTAMVVIGDTPADLTCGQSLGAAAIGVATGRYSVGELRKHDPVAVFPDLSETDAVVQAILAA